MKKYKSHKIVKAVKIDPELFNGEEFLAEGNEVRKSLPGIDGIEYDVSADIFARGVPKGEFYLVEYEGGYRSFSALSQNKWISTLNIH